MAARVVVSKGDVTMFEASKLSILLEVEGLTMKKKKRRVIKEVRNEHVGLLEMDLEGESESETRSDPMERLGEDMMMKIMAGLDARSLARALLVSHSWFRLASMDSLWSPLCEQLWIGKAHIPRWSKVPGLSKLVTYSRAITDSKRVRIMREDLWDHVWDFHFTEAAPDYWKNLDPYWGGVGPPMHRHFHPDGSITADPNDKVWGGHECVYTIVTGVFGDGKIRDNYVRVNRWPRLTISRREDWGWEMSNFISSYSSVPDASTNEGGTGPMFNLQEDLIYWFSSDKEV